MSLRILVADDHSLMRAGLCTLLNAEPGFEVVGEANTGEEAIDLANRLKPDLLLMDLNMPGMGGIEATRQVVKQQPAIRVLILTMYDEKGIVQEAIRAGASGYVLKKAVKSELIQAVQIVMQGDIYVHPSLMRALLAEPEPPQAQPSVEAKTLTMREVEILGLIARGYTNTQIAQALTISVRTVEFHRSNLMAKLGAESRMDLVHYASEHGYLENGSKSHKDTHEIPPPAK